MNAENAERNLWDQIRSLSQISVRLAQWGLATLLGFWTALYFVRRDMLPTPSSPPAAPVLPAAPSGLAELAFILPARHPLPVVRFIFGNLVLWAVAYMFYKMSGWIRQRLFYYIKSLRALPEEYPQESIRVYPTMPDNNRTMGVHMVTLFFFVPCADCFVYAMNWCFWWLKW
jgi:hypothetical protein